MIKLTAIQLCSTPNVENNLKAIKHQLHQLTNTDKPLEPNAKCCTCHIVVLPECCLFFGGKDSEQLTLAQHTAQSSQLINELSLLAKAFKVTLVAGTIPLLASCGQKFTNSSCVFSPTGALLAQYDKIHLFDVDVSDQSKQYRESNYTQAGQSLALISTPELTIGLSVCYDVRFAALYQKLRQQGADIITVPSAFTRVTGKAHWQALLQARAIENQVYIIAAGQEGLHANGRETWGHSMIISPWGEILDCIETGEGFITTEYHQNEINRIRAAMPVQAHNKFKVELKIYDQC